MESNQYINFAEEKSDSGKPSSAPGWNIKDKIFICKNKNVSFEKQDLR